MLPEGTNEELAEKQFLHHWRHNPDIHHGQNQLNQACPGPRQLADVLRVGGSNTEIVEKILGEIPDRHSQGQDPQITTNHHGERSDPMLPRPTGGIGQHPAVGHQCSNNHHNIHAGHDHAWEDRPQQRPRSITDHKNPRGYRGDITSITYHAQTIRRLTASWPPGCAYPVGRRKGTKNQRWQVCHRWSPRRQAN